MTKAGKRTISILAIVAAALALCLVVLAITTHAEEAGAAAASASEVVTNAGDALKQTKAIAAAAVIGIAAAAGAFSMALSIMKSVDSIARQPEAEGKIRTALMLGLVFIETAIIYALLVVILIIFVL